MAAEVPVCDVLCEAMEYLSKLGSNLRARSESLKEKRIRKDKLRNSHAVQKAADKVLLICELSKRSLENVESGVRNVLSKVIDRYHTSSKNVSSSPRATKNHEYQYLKVQSRSVKISKKVPLKHFMSVKVLARNMPMSLCEKYPVYYNCTLYRERKRLSKSKSKLDVKESGEQNNDEKVGTGKKDIECHESQNKSFGSSERCPQGTIESGNNNDLIDESNCEMQVKMHESSNRNEIYTPERQKLLEQDEVLKVVSDNSSKEINDLVAEENRDEIATEIEIGKTGADGGNNLNKDCEVFEQNKLEEGVVVNKMQVELKVTKANKALHTKIKSHTEGLQNQQKRFKHIKVIEDSSDSSEQLNEETSFKNENINNSSKKDAENDDESKLQNINSTLEKESAIEVASEKEEECKSTRPLIKCVSINKLLKPDVLEKRKDINFSIDTLGTDITKKKEHRLKVNSIDKYLSKKRNKESMDKNAKKKQISEIIISSDDEDYWCQKRKEVSTFKSKTFSVIINRLPPLTIKFLQLHKLNKITQNNKTVCEFSETHLENNRCLHKDNNIITKDEETEQIPIENINKVQNSLLNEADAEKSFSKGHTNLKEIGNTGKMTSLNYPTDANKINLGIQSRIENVSNIESQKSVDGDTHNEQCVIQSKDVNFRKEKTNNSDSVKNLETDIKNDKYCKDDNSKKIKTCLLAESDSDGVVERSIQNINQDSDKDLLDNDSSNQVQAVTMDTFEESSMKNCCSENIEEKNSPSQNDKKLSHDESNKSEDQLNIPLSKKRKRKQSIKHRRKHVMESLHAKKMLLTYSSSDTEDEQLKDVLKEIKDSLLKEMSSEEEKTEKLKVSSKSSTSSESDEDLFRKVKRLKKHSSDEDETITIAAEQQCSNSEKMAEKSKVPSVDSMDEKEKSDSKKMGRTRAQAGGSSQNSDSQEPNDKDIDGLTNLKTLMKSSRRRDSPDTDNKDSKSRNSKEMVKSSLINEENMLKPDSSSDSASANGAESDGDDADDLPSVTLTGLNGSGIDHLAKDDLLDESDTSTSHNEKDEISKKSESEEDHNPKSKRRKAHAISSDSEAGSSRKKGTDVKISDFEDSEDESGEHAKQNKRKKKDNESDASEGSSSDDGSKKKRRRIKQLNDSDVSGSDTENEGRNKHGRKNIRKVMGKNQLEEATKKAAREEKERIARIAERQKLYNNLEFDESGKPDEVVLEKVILDFDPETKEPLIQVDRGLVKKLKPHQANGIKFMWDACFESVKRIKKDRGSGCILAHCMGLGKTLQVVSLTHTLLTHSDLTTVNRVLVVCPLSTVLNWVNEFKMWLKHSETEYEVDVYELSRYKQNSERAFQLQQWFEHGGVCVLGYEMFRNLSADNSKKFKKKMLKNFQEALVDPGPDLVVCDEGHLLKNEKTSLSQSMNRVRTRRRIVLTGTPLQNNLKEYYCMVQFVKPNLLGKYNEYLNRFVNPITNGQYTDSTEHDIRIMKRRSHVLHKMLDGAVQRRDYGVLAPFLPPKHEYVLFITLTEVQIKLYQYYLDTYSRRPLPGKSSGFLFPDFQSLQRIWTHPLVLKYNSERYEIMQQKKREREEEEDSEGSLIDFIDDDSTPEESSTEESSDDLSDASDDSRKKSKKKKSQKKGKGKDSKMSTRRGTRANPVELEDVEANNEVVEIKAENPTEWWIKLVTDDELEDMRNSHKLVLLFDILRQCEAIGDKLLVFSQSLYSLDLIEHFLGKVDEATQEGRIDEKLAGHVGSWSPGIDYFRLDGSTSCENRSIWCKNFNREDNPRARLFLISTRAGGLGINLVAANRVVIFDVSWNPSHDVQSIFRVYRFGQKKPCYVYRFLAMGTMEEKIYERQVTKQAISKRVIDEQQIDRHYAENDLAELYKFEPHPPMPRPLPPLPKDRLFAEMLKEHEAQIYKYHEHDSLLENKEEETLSEEERKAAWEDFENEKNRPPPAPFPAAWPMHNGMMPGLLAQQQQQLAYAALAAMLRKDMPNINDNTIRDMLPHIYNSNPALMQKISELYKFAPPGGMMNPAMMNPVMNAGGGAGAMSGASGLQYEPPWQRQHQQQQQLRLQQLMQHQNQMGAKYYAGGLGSRDPVAMALQQQRAREIMAGDARSRPRGRPPLQPRAKPPSHADVVNLDSD